MNLKQQYEMYKKRMEKPHIAVGVTPFKNVDPINFREFEEAMKKINEV